MDLEYLLRIKPQNSGMAIFLEGSHGRFTTSNYTSMDSSLPKKFMANYSWLRVPGG